MRRLLLLLVLVLTPDVIRAVDPRDLLPKETPYDPAVPTPESYLGFRIGERHLQHHEIVGYLRLLAEKSNRVRLQEYARTHGRRPLLSLTITAPENHQRIEEIKVRHRRLTDPRVSAEVDTSTLPAVLWMGYGVHGNEPSASNAAPLVAYHLAAGTGPDHERLLREVVVLLDPCLNPDGFERFAHWANNHKGQTPNADPNHREHRESWPSGRTNYYWFDLNRDWLAAQHPESQGRLALYHQWKPNVVLDFHEMGSNATFFFPPGAPNRNHPLIPKRNVELTHALARRHAAALDRIGSLYFTEEAYDDFYPGKGSTYPDLHGAVGLLFEQASSRGHVQETRNGRLTFHFTIRNQVHTSLSSLKGTLELRRDLLEFQREAYREALAEAEKSAIKGWVLAAPGDPARLQSFIEILKRHEIQVHQLASNVEVEGRTFRKDDAVVVRLDQPETRFLQILFETRTQFTDTIFYDISTWTLPLAFNLTYAPLSRPLQGLLGPPYEPRWGNNTAVVPFRQEDLAYAIDWRSQATPKLLYSLLAAGVKVRVATEPLRIKNGETEQEFGYGSLLVPLGIQPEKRGQVVQQLRGASVAGVPIAALASGLTPGGIDAGSSAFAPLPLPKVALVTGEGVTAYDAGEVWHLLDRRLAMPLTLLDLTQLSTVDLSEYTTVVLVSGQYTAAPAAATDNLREFVSRGGTLIAQGTSINFVNRQKIVPVPLRERSLAAGFPARRPYAEADDDASLRLIRGAIFRTQIDVTHPLCYGYADKEPLPVFRQNTVILNPGADPYGTPVVYENKPLLSGYVSKENQQLLAGSAGIVVASLGTGRVILMPDNPNFRAFWQGTERLFVNSLFFGPILRRARVAGDP